MVLASTKVARFRPLLSATRDRATVVTYIRLSEPQVPRGLARVVGAAPAGSSGHTYRG